MAKFSASAFLVLAALSARGAAAEEARGASLRGSAALASNSSGAGGAAGGADAACKDSDASCGAWAAGGECKNNADWMLVNCRLSCSTCASTAAPTTAAGTTSAPTTTSAAPSTSASSSSAATTSRGGAAAPCADEAAACARWAAKGECSANAKYMGKHCRLSCKVCTTTASASQVMPADDDTGAAEGTNKECADESNACAEWAATGYCEKNPEFTRGKCRLSCQVCSVAATSQPQAEGCADLKEACPKWAKKGQCTKSAVFMSANCPRSCNLCSSVAASNDTAANQTSLPDAATEGGNATAAHSGE